MGAIALTGVIVQLSVLVFDGIVVYRWQLTKGGQPIPAYAYPLTLVGTLGLTVGMFLCGYIIEKSTKELKWKPAHHRPCDPRPRIVWVQKSQTVGDQGFRSFLIYAPVRQLDLMTSHRRHGRAKFHRLTEIACALSVAGM